VGDSQSTAKPWPADIGAKLDAERRSVVPKEKLADATAWRDRRMMALAAHKRAQEKKTPR
jgi:L-gulonate 3-dehydrogenase